MGGLALHGLLDRLNHDRGLHGFQAERGRKLLDALQIERVVQLDGEDELLQLHFAIAPGENSRPSCDGQVAVLVCDVRSLHRDVAIVAEVETVRGLVPIAFLLGIVRDERA